MHYLEEQALRKEYEHLIPNKPPSSAAKAHLINARRNSKMSKGEKIVHDFLNASNVKFTREYSSSSLKNEKTGYHLFIDFMLPDFKLAIEVDGNQHYHCHDKSETGKAKFAELQRRDRFKDQWCKDNGIEMIRIRCEDLKELPTILKGKFKIPTKPKRKRTKLTSDLQSISRDWKKLKETLDKYPGAFKLIHEYKGYRLDVDKEMIKEICFKNS